jgi:hypothetical protein
MTGRVLLVSQILKDLNHVLAIGLERLSPCVGEMKERSRDPVDELLLYIYVACCLSLAQVRGEISRVKPVWRIKQRKSALSTT